jgi:hypothetical protein
MGSNNWEKFTEKLVELLSRVDEEKRAQAWERLKNALVLYAEGRRKLKEAEEEARKKLQKQQKELHDDEYIWEFHRNPAVRDDWKYLAWHIKHGGAISNEMGEVIQEALEGKKRQNKKPATRMTEQRAVEMAWSVIKKEQASKKEAGKEETGKAVKAVAKEFKVTPRKVQLAVQKWRPRIVRPQSLEEYMDLVEGEQKALVMRMVKDLVADAGVRYSKEAVVELLRSMQKEWGDDMTPLLEHCEKK